MKVQLPAAVQENTGKPVPSPKHLWELDPRGQWQVSEHKCEW